MKKVTGSSGSLFDAAEATPRIRVVESATAAVRLHEGRRFLLSFEPGTEILLVGASRGAVDDLARAIALEQGATFGLHRFSFTQLAARLAAIDLAERGRAAITALGHEAVATRAAFEAGMDSALEYFSPVAQTPGFPKALARTLLELRLASIGSGSLARLLRSGPDLAELLDRVDILLNEAGASDRAALFETAARAVASVDNRWGEQPVLLLDVPFESDTESKFLWALIEHSPRVLLTVPTGDVRTLAQLQSYTAGFITAQRGPVAGQPHPSSARKALATITKNTCHDIGPARRAGRPRPAPPAGRNETGGDFTVEALQPTGDADLARLARYLFSTEPPPIRERSGELIWFSAPGEGRECVEIARRIIKEAADGVRFDEMAILIRSPQQYVSVLEHALARARIPAYFDRGTRRPHPAGRAFLAILSCAVEHFSAKRFAEYLSLGQVPSLSGEELKGAETWVASRDEVFGVLAERSSMEGDYDGPAGGNETSSRGPLASDDPAGAVVAGTLRAPWKWEQLLVESSVIGGSDRWARRLNGLAEEYRLKIRELKADDPDTPRIAHLERELQNLEHLRAFALPLVEIMSGWPERASWGEWLQRLEGFVSRVLRRPEDVLRILADLRPMAAVGPVTLVEVRDVLADRLRSLEVDPPAHRYGRVFVGSPHQARGRTFRIVFVPGLAERLFPQKVREDPLLLDDLRRDVPSGERVGVRGLALPIQNDRAEMERLLLRLAIGAAIDRLYVSFPRVESSEVRARVPSFYALEMMRAVTGRVPDHQSLQRDAAEEAQASLAWPAPIRAADAIDDFEHDLSILRSLMRSEDDDVKGRAQYMLRLNDCLRRSITERWARAKPGWSQYDGIARVTDATRPFLQTQRLGARPYSVSALQQYAACPYRFLLSAGYRLAPLEEPEPLQRMDPLTKGSLFHQVQAEFFRALQRMNLTINEDRLEGVYEILDDTLSRVAAEYYERLAPAVDRVWEDDVASVRTDLRVWVGQLALNTDWEPWLFEFAFGLPDQPGHDPKSRPDPLTIDGRFSLRGSVDLVERKRGTKILRVTDHKTSRNRSQRGSVIGAGQQLQPVIYSLAVEAATGCTVETARFSYCTTAGGFTEHKVPINEQTRRTGIEVLEVIDRAVELGMLPPAPAERACSMCDFLSVCGPDQERRAQRKSPKQIADLIELRHRP